MKEVSTKTWTRDVHKCHLQPKGVAVAYEKLEEDGSVMHARWWIASGYCSHLDIVACPWCGEKLD